MEKASAFPERRTAWRSGISASEQRSNLSYARSRPATTVIRSLDKIDDEAEQSAALTDNNVRITKDSSRKSEACWRRNSKVDEEGASYV